MKLIDKDALLAEIEKLKGKVSDSSSYCNGWQQALRMLELSLNTLEVKEINLDFEQELYKAFGQVKDFTLGIAIAKRFYDMGRKHNEPVSEDLEEASRNYADNEEYGDDVYFAIETAFEAGAKWQKEQIKEALLSEILPYFMHGGEADEVVAKLDEVLNQKR